MNTFKVKLTEGFLIALLPILGYISAYCFESGYLFFYGIGEEFVSINLESVIISIFAILSILIIVVFLLDVFYPFILKYQSDNPVHSRLLLFFAVFIIGLFAYLIIPTIWTIFLEILLIMLLLIGLFVLPLLKYHKENISYLEKLKKDENKIKTNNKIRSFIVEILFSTGLRPLTAMIILILIIAYIAYFMGMFFASIKTTYLVYKNNSNSYIVIRSNKEGKIAIGVDLNEKSIKNTFLIINSSKDLGLSRVNTGKLSNKTIRLLD